MKKTLLLLASMVVGAASAFAQWTQPVPAFVPMADDGETEQYLYNVEAGGFLVGANDWSTRASISTKNGVKVKIEKAYEDDEKTTPTGYWKINNFVERSDINGWRYMWANIQDNGAQDIYVDYASQGDPEHWTFIELGGNKYEISHAKLLNSKLGMFGLLDGSLNDRLWLIDNDQEDGAWVDAEGKLRYENAYTTWAFVSVEEYDLLIPRIAAYNAALSLKALMDSEDAALVDASAAKAVYDNTNSTAEELAAAEAALNQAILDAKANLATPENPIDMTNAIVNPNFDNIKFDGWLGSGWGAGGATDECAERYDMAFDTYQDIKGLAKGVYKVLVNGFFRGEAANTPVLYGKSGDDLLTTPIANQLDGAAEEEVAGCGVLLSNGKYGPNSMQDFVKYENAGYYNDMFIYVPVGEGGDLRIGVKKENKGGGTEWVIVDTWRLIYYGNSAAAYKFWYDDIKANVIKKMDSMISDDTKYDKTQKAVFEAALAAGEAAQTEADFRAAIEGLNKAADAATASIEAYKKYEAKVNEIRDYLGENTDIMGDKIMELSDYVMEGEAVEPNDEWKNGSAEYILENCLLTTEEITAETEWLDAFYKEAIKTGMAEGSDVSFMLTNPKFDGNFDGWTYKEGKLGDKNVECYQQVVDVYQVVEDVPNGLYMLTCQAFERPGENGQWSGDEDPKVFLFMNNFQSPVQNIGKGGITYDEAQDRVNCMLNAEGQADNVWPNDYEHPEWGIVPNSVQGARYAFESGRYVQKVYGLVTDGKMKIGLTSNGQQIHWVLWANFTLTYMGKNAEALESVLADLTATLSEYIEENSDNMSEKATAAASAAISAADAANDADEMWDALVAVNNQITAAKENVAAVEAFLSAKDAMIDAAESNPDASDEAFAAYTENSDVEYIDMTTEEIIAQTEKFKEVAAKLRIPGDAASASDANPVDFTQIIVNPAFDAGTEGWSGDQAAYNGEVADAEFYNKNFNMYQEFYGLPAGTYEFKVQGYYRQGNAEPDYKAYTGVEENHPNAKIFANNDSIAFIQPSSYTTESREELSDYAKCGAGVDGDLWIPNTMTTGGNLFAEGYYWNSLIFKYDGQGVLKLGIDKQVTISGDWTLFDNFQLIYYGPNSSKEPNGGTDAIEATPAVVAAPAAIYNAAGIKVNNLTKGLNIVKMTDGTVRKVLVK